MAELAAQFRAISLADLNHHAALQTRADNKYFLAWPTFVAFADALRQNYVMLEIDGQRSFTYDTQYFDTDQLTNYWSHVQGRRKRFKVRSRRYVDSGLCVFEIKLKGGRGQTIKYKMSYAEAERDVVTPKAASFLQERIYDSYGQMFSQPLAATLRTHYQRITLTSLTSMERITCDFNLAFAVDNCWQGQMAPDHVLVETKSERGRGEADQILWGMGERPAAGSKYCLGLSLVQPQLRSNPFQHVRKQYFVRDDEPGTETLPAWSQPVPNERTIARSVVPITAPTRLVAQA
jgi:hypothetical protein